jgi:hypothetical protein
MNPDSQPVLSTKIKSEFETLRQELRQELMSDCAVWKDVVTTLTKSVTNERNDRQRNEEEMRCAFQQGVPMPGPTQRNDQIPKDSCFYCWSLDHRVANCPHRAQHLADGWISLDSNKYIKKPDGSNFPPDPSGAMVSWKIRVEAFYKGRDIQLMIEGLANDLTGSVTPTGGRISVYNQNAPWDVRDSVIERQKQQMVDLQNQFAQQRINLPNHVVPSHDGSLYQLPQQQFYQAPSMSGQPVQIPQILKRSEDNSGEVTTGELKSMVFNLAKSVGKMEQLISTRSGKQSYPNE